MFTLPEVTTLYYVPILVNGVKVNALIDTGCNCMIVSKKFVE